MAGTRILAGGLASALLAGCATTADLPPPVLAYSGRDCASAPDLSRAYTLTPEKPKKLFTVATPVDGMTGCLRSDGAATPYLVYALPQSQVRMIEIGAQLEPTRILSPSVEILDEAGKQVRTFAPDQFLYRGGVLSVQFVPHPGERFVLVTVDPARVGKNYDSIATGINTTTVWTGYGVAQWRSGFDEAVSRAFSWEGMVQAVVHSADEEG